MGLESLLLFTSAGLKGKLQGLEKKKETFLMDKPSRI